MSSVDERIVRMQFDNSGFEAGATRAIGILDKLSEALKLDGAKTGLDGAKKAIEGFSMDPVSSSVDACARHFSVFEATVFGIFSSLGNKIFNFGENLVKNLTVKPFMDGFGEYETQMRSVQTILSNTRSKLSEAGISDESDQIALINSKLDELNEYADKTIYNFSEMTRNIGTFTAAGVDLNTATQSIQGIANLAAASGSTSQQASTAMYQLSQAIASGTVKLQDWNSVVNAGMGGELFQEALKRTARNMGTDVDAIIEKAGSFRESLQAGWITSDVLTETLKQLTMSYEEVGDEAYNANLEILRNQGYSQEDAVAILDLAKNAQEAATKVRTWTQLWDTVGEALGSGWATTWRTIVGDFSEATDLFTHLSDRITSLIGASADARNAILKEWASGGGRDALVLGIKNSVDAIFSTIEAIGKAFNEVFGITAEQIYNITVAFAEFSKKIVPSQRAVDGIYSVFYDLFTIIHNVIGVVGNFARIFISAARIAWDFAEPLRWLAEDVFKGALTGLASFSSKFLAFTDVMEEKIPGFLTNIKEMANFLRNKFSSIIKSVVKVLTAPIRMFDYFFDISGAFITVIESIGSAVSSFLKSLDIFAVVDTIEHLDKFITVDLASTFKKFGLEWLYDLSFAVADALERFSSAFEVGMFELFQVIKYIVDDISHIASTFGEVIGEFFGFFDLFPEAEDKGSGFVGFIKDFVQNGFGSLIDALEKYSSLSDEDVKSHGIIKWIYSLIEYLKGAESDIRNFATNFGDSMREFLNGSKIFGAVRDFLHAVPEWGSNFLNQAKNLVKGSNLLTKAKSGLSSLGSKILPKITSAFITFGSKLKSVVKSVVGYFKELTPEKLQQDLANFVGNIQSKLDRFAPFLSEIFSNISSKFMGFISSITDGSNTFGDVFNKIKDSVTNAFSNLPDTVKGLFDSIVNMFRYGKDNIQKQASELSFDNIFVNFSNIGTNISSLVQGILDGVLSIPDSVSGVWDSLMTSLEKFLGFMPSFENLMTWAKPILDGGVVVAIIGMVTSIKKLATTVGNLGQAIIDWPKKLGGALFEFGRGFNKWREETKADQVLKIATALLILAGALFIIASLPADDLARAGDAMAKMAIGVAAFLVIFSLMDKFKVTNAATLAGIGAALQGLGVGMLGMAAAAWILSTIPDEQLKKGAEAVTGLVATLALYMAAAGRGGGSMVKAGVGMIFLAGAVYLLTFAIEKFGEADPKALEQGLDAFDRVMFSLSVFGAIGAKGIAALLSSVAKLGAGIIGIAIGFAILTVSMNLMSDSLKKMDNLWTVVGVMAGTIILFSVAAYALKDADPASLGVALIALAGAVVIMSLGFAMLNGVDWESIVAGAVAMAGLMLVFAAISKWAFPKELIQTGQAMLLLAVAIDAMSVGLFVLSGIPWENLAVAAGSVAALMGLFAIISRLVEPERLVAAGTSFMMLGASILIMSAGFKVFETIDSGKMWQSFAIIALIMGGFAAIASLVNPVSLIALGKSFAIFSTGLLVLAAAFKAFEAVNPESITSTLIAMGAAVGIFVAMCWLLTPVAEIAIGVSVALLAFSASVLVLAAAFWVAAHAIEVLNEIGPEGIFTTMEAFGAGLASIIESIAAKAPEIGKALVNLAVAVFQELVAALGPVLESLWGWLVAHFPQFVEWGKNILSKIFEAFSQAAQWLGEHFPEIMSALATFFGQVAEALGPIIQSLWGSLQSLIQWIGENLWPLVVSIVENIKNTIAEKLPLILETISNWKDSLLASIGTWVSSLVEAGGNLIEGLKQGIAEKVSSLAESAQQVFDNFVNSVKSFFGIASPSTVMQGIGENVVQGLINGIGNLIGNLGSKALEIGSAVLNGVGDIAGGLKDKAVNGMTAFTNGVGSFIGSATSKGSEIVGGVINGAKDLAGKMKTKAADGMNSFVTGMSSKISTVKSTATKIANSVVDGFKNLASRLKSTVSNAMDGVRSAISGAAGKISGAVSSIKNKIIDGFSGLYGTFKSIGENIGSGLKVGMDGITGAVTEKARAMGRAAANAAKQGAEVASPSKLTIETGQFIGEGLIVGMINRMSKVVETGKKLGKTAIEGCNEAVSGMALSIQDVMDTDYEPVITPVINPAQFNSDLSSLNRAMNMNMNRIVLDGMNYNAELNAKMVDYADSNNRALQAIADGVIDYNLLGTAVATALINSGIHVEMDGGQLMGYLAGEIRDVRRMYG